MEASRLKQLEEIYHAAAKIPLAGRESFIKESCGADIELRREVESLLSFEQASRGFLDTSPKSLVADMFAEQENKISVIDKEVGHYKVLQLLGAGGMGEVYLAEDVNLNRRVALKFLSVPVSGDKNSLRRFKQEAFAASALNHPNILTVYEFVTEGEVCFLATEYVQGETLRETLRGGKPTLRETLDVAEQIAFALSAAHKARIVHRDVKPDNIMLREDGIAKILDFGLAKLTEQQQQNFPADSEEQKIRKSMLTKPGMIMGTAAYMSPEQVRGLADIDGRTDIWSLGVVLFEMISGRVPFAGENTGDMIASILKTDAPRLSKVMGEFCPPELDRIIDKALAKNVEERYQAMQDLALDIKSLKRRLEFEAELTRSNPPGELPDSNLKNRLVASAESPESDTRIMPAASVTQAQSLQNSEQNFKAMTRVPLWVIPSVLLIAVIGGIFVWKFNESRTGFQTTTETNASVESNATAAKPAPSLSLNYSLTVQSYNDGSYKNPFKLSGEMLFRNKDRVRLNVQSPETGFLYILNQSPKDAQGESSFNILFPSPTTNEGKSQLAAGEEIQIPQQSWFELDAKEGTELVWLVWSKNAVSELESAKRFANPSDRGKIKDASLEKSIETLLTRYQSKKENVVRDDDKKESQITANTAILAHIIKLEHH